MGYDNEMVKNSEQNLTTFVEEQDKKDREKRLRSLRPVPSEDVTEERAQSKYEELQRKNVYEHYCQFFYGSKFYNATNSPDYLIRHQNRRDPRKKAHGEESDITVI